MLTGLGSPDWAHRIGLTGLGSSDWAHRIGLYRIGLTVGPGSGSPGGYRVSYDDFEQPVDQAVAGHAVGLSLEVEQQPMTQDRVGAGADVFERNVEAAGQEGACFAGQSQRLHCSRAGPKPYLARDLGHAAAFGRVALTSLTA